MKLPLYIVLFLFGLAIAQSIYFYPLLPNIVSSHFDAAGNVNGRSPKLTYFILYFISLAITSSFTLLLPLILKYLPTSSINLPHREYWLSGDRREETLSFFSMHFAWLGVAITGLMVTVFHLTFLASLSPNKDFNINVPFWSLLGAFLLFTVWWVVVLLRRFPSPS